MGVGVYRGGGIETLAPIRLLCNPFLASRKDEKKILCQCLFYKTKGVLIHYRQLSFFSFSVGIRMVVRTCYLHDDLIRQAFACHRLTAARSRSRSYRNPQNLLRAFRGTPYPTTPWCHSLRSRRFATPPGKAAMRVRCFVVCGYRYRLCRVDCLLGSTLCSPTVVVRCFVVCG